MQIQIRGKGLELNPELRERVTDKLASALERFESRIARVSVFLTDVNGPKKGVDKSLRVVIDIARLPLMILEEKGESWNAMLDQMVERAAHTVGRQVDRVRSRTDRTSMAGNSSGLNGNALD